MLRRKRRSKAEMKADAEKIVDDYVDAICQFGIMRIGTVLVKSKFGGVK